MKDLNMVFLMGNLTRDPELRYTPNGQAVTSITIATNRQWTDKDSGDKKDQAEFTDVVIWGKMAENVANYLKKGRRAHIIGRLQTRSWEAQDGSKRNKTEVVATDVTFLDRANSGSGDSFPSEDFNQEPAEEKKSKTNKKVEEEVNIEDIPF
jgi:single-strand DNA-binding protein